MDIETASIIEEIQQERLKQDLRFGEQNHDPIIWSAILTEEVLEYIRAAFDFQFGGNHSANIRDEAIQIAAVAQAIVECCDRQNWVLA